MRPLVVVKTGSTVPGVRARRGDFEDWFLTGTGWDPADASVVAVHRGGVLPAPEDVAGAIVTGSPAMATDAAPWSLETERWLAAAARGGVPLLCVCYGHQLLARALGGRAGWNPRGREIGTVAVDLTDAAAGDALFGGLPSPLDVQESHLQSVLELPPGARRLAHNPHDPNQAFAYGERAWSVQFHPEFDADIVRGYVDDREEEIRSEGLDPQRLRAHAREAPGAAALLRRFAAEVRES